MAAFQEVPDTRRDVSVDLLIRRSAGSAGEVSRPATSFVSGFEEQLQTDELNKELLMRLQEFGIATPVSTRINGRFAIRAVITNHGTRREDFEVLVREVIRLGEQVLRET